MRWVIHGHLAGPADVATSPSAEPTTIAAAAAVAPTGTTVADILALAAGRAEGGPADPAALRRAAPGGPAAAGRPILPVDARLQNESVDASDAHDTLSDADDDGGPRAPGPARPPAPAPTPTPRRRSRSSCRRSSMDAATPLVAAVFPGCCCSLPLALSAAAAASRFVVVGAGDSSLLVSLLPATSCRRALPGAATADDMRPACLTAAGSVRRRSPEPTEARRGERASL
ncbi:hypothetical protein ACP4OV_023610 [Aristida adscensionis]